MRRGLGALVVAAAVLAVLPSSAVPHVASTAWQFHWSGKTFGGTYTNPTHSVVNAVSIGTALKAKNPITSFTFDGIKCGLYAPYGSSYCYTGISIAPGKSASFSGTTHASVGIAGFQACDSADGGANNTCVDVTLQSAAPKASFYEATTVATQLDVAIAEEGRAITDLKLGYTRRAEIDLGEAISRLTGAMKYTATLPASVGADVGSALHLDTQARDLFKGSPSGRKAAIAKIEDALVDKKVALQTANDAKR